MPTSSGNPLVLAVSKSNSFYSFHEFKQQLPPSSLKLTGYAALTTSWQRMFFCVYVNLVELDISRFGFVSRHLPWLAFLFLLFSLSWAFWPGIRDEMPHELVNFLAPIRYASPAAFPATSRFLLAFFWLV